jgi:hypothetical protein
MLPATSLVLCAASAVLWVLSLFINGRSLYSLGGGRYIAVTLGPGSLSSYYTDNRPQRPTEWKSRLIHLPPREGLRLSFRHPQFGKFTAIPFWMTLVLFALPPLAWEVRKRRLARLELAKGCCDCCGYDLRATPDRCPECGAVPGKQITESS